MIIYISLLSFGTLANNPLGMEINVATISIE